jgi:hypothetical protein
LRGAFDPQKAGRPGGLPVQGTGEGLCSVLRFARRRASTNPGIRYQLEQTDDLIRWTPVPASVYYETIVRTKDDWEEVEATILDNTAGKVFYRISLSPQSQ